jgi:hypothetical protein
MDSDEIVVRHGVWPAVETVRMHGASGFTCHRGGTKTRRRPEGGGQLCLPNFLHLAGDAA